MNQTSIESICNELESELARLGERSEQLKAELNTADSERKRVQAALRALGVVGKTKAPSRKPSASKADVIEIVASMLGSNETLSEVELRRRVDASVTDAGKSRMGLALRMKEALADERFVETGEGYRLADVVVDQ